MHDAKQQSSRRNETRNERITGRQHHHHHREVKKQTKRSPLQSSDQFLLYGLFPQHQKELIDKKDVRRNQSDDSMLHPKRFMQHAKRIGTAQSIIFLVMMPPKTDKAHQPRNTHLRQTPPR
jgi:hypothetical protein